MMSQLFLADLLKKGFANKKGGWQIFLFLETRTGVRDERPDDIVVKVEDSRQDYSLIRSDKKAIRNEDQGEVVFVRMLDHFH